MKLTVFPEECKIAKLKPLRQAQKSVPKNYRSISLLPLVSKIIEKSRRYQLQDYL